VFGARTLPERKGGRKPGLKSGIRKKACQKGARKERRCSLRDSDCERKGKENVGKGRGNRGPLITVLTILWTKKKEKRERLLKKVK